MNPPGLRMPTIKARITLAVVAILGGVIAVWLTLLLAYFLGLFVGEPGAPPP